MYFSCHSDQAPDKKQLKGKRKEERFILAHDWMGMIHHAWAGSSTVLAAWTWDFSCHASEHQETLIWLLLSPCPVLGPSSWHGTYNQSGLPHLIISASIDMPRVCLLGDSKASGVDTED